VAELGVFVQPNGSFYRVPRRVSISSTLGCDWRATFPRRRVRAERPLRTRPGRPSAAAPGSHRAPARATAPPGAAAARRCRRPWPRAGGSWSAGDGDLARAWAPVGRQRPLAACS
jgi:hypothetical protein